MEQLYDQYTAEQQEVWKMLYSRQEKNLQGRVAPEYLQSLASMKQVLNAEAIPYITAINEVLLARNGWSIHIVPGLIPVNDFFSLLAQKKFCSSTWLRTMAQLDYLEEPDMFHDIFGHIPLFWNHAYAAMMREIGLLGVKHAANSNAVSMLERFYWFTVEFGLAKDAARTEIYGAGIISSFGETNSIFEAGVTIKPFNLREILYHDFVKNELQNLYYEVPSLDALYAMLPSVDAMLLEESKRVNAIPLATLTTSS